MGDLITMITDFGMGDAYVGIMKGVILGINPNAKIIDVCHPIEPQNIPQAAFVLSTAYKYFPPDTIHMVIVDPGVGSERKAIVVKTPVGFFVAPDNGVLSYVIEEAKAEGVETKAITLTNPIFWRSPVSPTFHGRDIFAPVAAHLSLGVPLSRMGEPIASLVTFPIHQPRRSADGTLVCHIIHIDSFGNLITDAKREDIPVGKVVMEVAGHRIEGISFTYAEGSELMALVGSSGRLEISVKNGNAARLLGAKVGDEVRLIVQQPPSLNLP